MAELCYDPPVRCTSGPTRGAIALMTWALSRFIVSNWGIYNCRNVGGSTTLSVHGEGRADDFGTVVVTASGRGLAALLVKHAAELGVQVVIYNRQIWSATRAAEGWRPYTGPNPHTDHVHAELCRWAAESLTVERIIEITEGDDMPDQRYFDTKFDRNATRIERTAGTIAKRVRESEARIIKAIGLADNDDVTVADIEEALAEADSKVAKEIAAEFRPVLEDVLGEIHVDSLTESDRKGLAEAIADELAVRLSED